MIYSTHCIDESQGFQCMPDGSYKSNKLGRLVMTLEECEAKLQHRRMYGDLRPALIELEMNEKVKKWNPK